jgi:hypothetical protein
MVIGAVNEIEHNAARIGVVLVDWTARQHNADAEWPVITVDAQSWTATGRQNLPDKKVE